MSTNPSKANGGAAGASNTIQNGDAGGIVKDSITGNSSSSSPTSNSSSSATTSSSSSSSNSGATTSSSNNNNNNNYPPSASMISQIPMMMHHHGAGGLGLGPMPIPLGSGGGSGAVGGGMPPVSHGPPPPLPLQLHGSMAGMMGMMPPPPGINGVAVGTIAIPSGVNPAEFIMNALAGGAAGGGGFSPMSLPMTFGAGLAGPTPTTTTTAAAAAAAAAATTAVAGGSAATSHSTSTGPPKAKKAKISDGSSHPQEQQQQNAGETTNPGSHPTTRPPVVAETKPPPTDLPAWKEFLKGMPRCGPADGIRESSYFYKKHNSASSRLMSRKYRTTPNEYGDTVISARTLKRLFQEFDTLEESLPVDDPQSAVWIRFDEEHPQYMRAVMAASLAGTSSPFAGGLFAFDIFVGTSYPATPPQVHLLNTSETQNGFGPNLYRNGKVCLSLLGTWSGPGWKPAESSIYQVLMSIHALILGVEHPYFLEPGHGGWEGTIKDGAFQQATMKTSSIPPSKKEEITTKGASSTKKKAATATQSSPPASSLTPPAQSESKSKPKTASMETAQPSNNKDTANGDSASMKTSTGSATATVTREVGIPLHVVLYEDEIRVSTVKYAMIDAIDKKDVTTSFWHPFKDVVEAHFHQNKNGIVFEIEKWLSDDTVGRDRQLAKVQYRTTQLMIDKVQSSLPELKRRIDNIVTPNKKSEENSSDTKNSEKTPAALKSGDPEADSKNSAAAGKSSSVSDCGLAVARIRNELKKKLDTMDVYVRKKDYIMAGQIQEETNRLEKEIDRLEKLQPALTKIETSMEKAASNRDYIRAGRLQAQMKELLKDDTRSQLPTTTKYKPKKSYYGLSGSGPANGFSTSGAAAASAAAGGSSHWNDDGFYTSDDYLDAMDAGMSFGAPFGTPGMPPTPSMSNVYSLLDSALGMTQSDGLSSAAPLSSTANGVSASNPPSSGAAATSSSGKQSKSSTSMMM